MRDDNPQDASSDDPRCPSGACCGGEAPAGTSRREFIKLAGVSAASLAAFGSAARLQAAVAAGDLADDHFVPVDKGLDPGWIRMLSAKGEPTIYSGDDLKTIAMPVGGVCAGQVYLTGDGRLTHFDVFNIHNFTGYGREAYDLGRTTGSPLLQGFAIKITSGGKTTVRSLDRAGFPGVQFCGEYPIATIDYADKGMPVAVTLRAFSPFCPLEANDSGLPATVMEYRLKNTSDAPVEATLAGWLENGVCIDSGKEMDGFHTAGVARSPAMSMLLYRAQEAKTPGERRPPILFADFEGEDYGEWKVEGKAFGTGPAHGTLEKQQDVSGFAGKGLVNTYLGGDDKLTGKLTSPEFTIERRFITFLVGGGPHAGKTCMNLLVDGKIVHTATGKQVERLLWHNFNVSEFVGKAARLEIVDNETGPWGHINIDQIEFRDTPRSPRSGPLGSQPDFGTMGLALIDGGRDALVNASVDNDALPDVFDGLQSGAAEEVKMPFGKRLTGALGKSVTLGPGEEARVAFAVVWHFPNRPDRGNYYASRFKDAGAVGAYLAANYDGLAAQTQLWHDTWYDSTLPHWLLDRLFSTVSALATSTCQRWENGRFWAWEGVGCCHGTCTHVWNYEHAMARLFPELERSCREMQDYGTGFEEETGMVRFRGEGWGMWAGDGQAGTVLKAYREHQTSADDAFLKRNWKKIRKSLEFLIGEDRGGGQTPDGLIEGSQHNTYDINFFGANAMIGSLYLAALKAGQQMATEMGDADFAKTCAKLAESGSKLTVKRLFNGEYFIQEVDLAQHPKAQYGEGCLSDQLFGQGWAHQVALGYVYPEETIHATLAAIWKYNWAPDIGPQNAVHKPERWFASPGEAGLFTCTWPHTKHLPAGVRYKNEVWTGIEYQVAGNMAYDGMVTEALAICRGIHERYHPSKHNPFNEVECGDHYARGMASHGVFQGLCGFEYHGPNGHLGFAPRVTPDDFQAAFTAAEGWGTLTQTRQAGRQTNRIAVKWGTLRLKTLALELPEGAAVGGVAVTLDGWPVKCRRSQEGTRVAVTLDDSVVVGVGKELQIEIQQS